MSRSLWLATLFFMVSVTANAEMILIDDFNDGNDDGWTRLDPTVDELWGPGIYDASLGAYHLESSDLVTQQQADGIFADWDASADPIYSQGFVRAVMRRDSPSTNPFIYVRATPGVAPKGGEGYLFVGGSGTSQFFIDGDAGLHAVGTHIPFLEGVDYILEGGVVEGERILSSGTRVEGVWVSLKVWPADEEEPAEPQLRIWDSTPQPPGALGVGTWLGPLSTGLLNSATFDDIYFTPVPEPSSLLLALLGIVGLLHWRRWRK